MERFALDHSTVLWLPGMCSAHRVERWYWEELADTLSRHTKFGFVRLETWAWTVATSDVLENSDSTAIALQGEQCHSMRQLQLPLTELMYVYLTRVIF